MIMSNHEVFALLIKVMGTIASQIKGPSKNTPHCSIIIEQGVSPGS